MSDEEPEPNCPFAVYMAEGDLLYQKGQYAKAIDSYSTALQLDSANKNCLVARSKCYLKLGDSEAALKDAEASLCDDKEFFKGLYQKAEVLYSMGDFEFALVFYHRGHKLRPELQEFRLGIQKAQEAIDDSVGSPSSVKLENKGDLSFFNKQKEATKTKLKPQLKVQKREHKQQSKKEETPKNDKITRQLLGELYNDKEYLEKLLRDEDLTKGNTRTGEKVKDLILNGIAYLDTRTEFWRQQKPIYARERDRRLLYQKWNREKPKKILDTTKYILKSLEEIDQLLSSGNAEGSSNKAKQVLKTFQGWSDCDVSNKNEVIGNLYSCIGNAQIEMGDMEAALEYHKKDLEIAHEHDLLDAKSRALDNIGRVYARIGDFRQAVEVWEEKIPLAKSNLEKAWLYHEIGRCYLELNCNVDARDYGEKSLLFAQEAEDDEWKLNASVLIAQSEVKLGDNQTAITYFEKALETAKLLNDEAAERAIINALEYTNKQIVDQLKTGKAEDESRKQNLNEVPKQEVEEEITKRTAEPEVEDYYTKRTAEPEVEDYYTKCTAEPEVEEDFTKRTAEPEVEEDFTKRTAEPEVEEEIAKETAEQEVEEEITKETAEQEVEEEITKEMAEQEVEEEIAKGTAEREVEEESAKETAEQDD
nr:PREDICTED: tetratricopeptide repeat protein 25 isoform X1 [Latimeria chalumnae]XP_014350292.1 PREDICTED: tetratricopeptide repeat protein 25 isoform X2 [Latimeria chalumnae]|eukprot:XP_014350291.1 PREDICTED: tetratricopeptide repeat protein 25 isoform X1 [Latimeria chalumnae]